MSRRRGKAQLAQVLNVLLVPALLVAGTAVAIAAEDQEPPVLEFTTPPAPRP